MKRILVVGAGPSGATLARELAEAGYSVTVYDQRDHVAGNCHTRQDDETGVMVHAYGPHIFHTDQHAVWDYVRRFADFEPFVLRVKATVRDRVFSLPINLLTINQFFSRALTPAQARRFIAERTRSFDMVRSFEEQALSMIGPELYKAFFRGYTLKQWGVEPADLPASILKRLPVRFDYNDNYFNHRYQGIPRSGYSAMVENMLRHDHIELHLGRPFRQRDREDFDHVFYSGTIDSWFEHRLGRLRYRTLDFVQSTHGGDYQGCPIMNYPDTDVLYTRVTEHKHFTPWQQHEKTVVFHEYSRDCTANDVPYYPVRLLEDKSRLSRYVELAQREHNVTFMGRLGTYRYLDMDVTIAEALSCARNVIERDRESAPIPAFFNSPLG